MSNKYKFRCKFCDSGFVQEDRFHKHRCKQMVRDEEIRTPVGMAALEHYKLWMSVQRRMTPSVETFLDSKLYTSFIKFAKFAQSTGIPNVEQYIKFMIRQDIHPTIWVNDQIYGTYLQYLDRGADPILQAEYTIEYLFKISEALDCEVDQIFDNLQPGDVIMMLRRRQLSPWILLHSPRFKAFLTGQTNEDERIILQSLIKPKIWAQKRKDDPKSVSFMKKVVRELNL